MKKYCVDYTKFCDKRQQDITFGTNIEAISEQDALDKAIGQGLRNPKVLGRLVAEIDQETGERIEYENTMLN